MQEKLKAPDCGWDLVVARELEQRAQAYAIANVVPEHLNEVRSRRTDWTERTRAAVKDRLTKEISYWDHRAEELKLQEQAGKPNARLNSQEARRRADDLQARLQKRMEQLEQEAQISALPPVVLGGVVVVPAGLLAKMTGREAPSREAPADTQASAARARAIVMDVERRLGFDPVDREDLLVRAELDDLRFILQVVNGRSAEITPGDRVHGGLHVRNSEVG